MTITLGQTLPIDSALRTIHTQTGTPLADALEALPDWVTVRDQLLALGEPQPFGGSGDRAVEDLVATVLASGTPLTAEVHAQAAKVYAEAHGRDLVHRAANKVRADLSQALDQTVRANVTTLVRHLADTFATVLEQADVALTALGPIRDAETAVDAGVLDHLKALRELGTTYFQIRQGQAALFQLTESHGRKMTDLVTAFVADPEAVDDELIPRRLNIRVDAGNGNTRDPKPAPWPVSWTSTEALAWCVNHPEAKPWVPTAAQMDQAEDQLIAATTEVQTEMNRSRLPAWAQAQKRANRLARAGR